MDEKSPQHITAPLIALLTCPLAFEGPSRDSEIEISKPEQLSAFLDAGERYLEDISNMIISTGVNAVFTSESVDPGILHRLSDEGVFVLADVERSDLNNIAAATGAQVSDLLRDLTFEELGSAGRLYVQRAEGRESVEERIHITDCENPAVVTIDVGGANEIATEEVIRGLHDSLKSTTLALNEGFAVPGGGYVHVRAALDIRTVAEGSAGRERLAMESFARALENIPFILADNAGKDGLDSILELRAAIRSGDGTPFGITTQGEVGEVSTVRIPSASLDAAFKGAYETAASLLRVDQVISVQGD